MSFQLFPKRTLDRLIHLIRLIRSQNSNSHDSGSQLIKCRMPPQSAESAPFCEFLGFPANEPIPSISRFPWIFEPNQANQPNQALSISWIFAFSKPNRPIPCSQSHGTLVNSFRPMLCWQAPALELPPIRPSSSLAKIVYKFGF